MKMDFVQLTADGEIEVSEVAAYIEPCHACEGTGKMLSDFVPGEMLHLVECPDCYGLGEVEVPDFRMCTIDTMSAWYDRASHESQYRAIRAHQREEAIRAVWGDYNRPEEYLELWYELHPW